MYTISVILRHAAADEKGAVVFYFFFFSNMLSEEPLITQAISLVFRDKLVMDGYCVMSEYIYGRINKEEMRRQLEAAQSPLAVLYRNAYPRQDNIAEMWNKYREEGLADLDEEELRPLEARAIVNWIFRAYPNSEKRMDALRELMGTARSAFDIRSHLALAGGVVYMSARVEIHFIRSLGKFSDILAGMGSAGHSLFFRGHADANYLLIPSVLRSAGWRENERRMYNELLISCPQDFAGCRTHLDYLVEMQHYGLPTRLLDITRNPLVALHFACASHDDATGELIAFKVDDREIKYPQSDTVAILASLPLFDSDKQQEFYRLATDKKLSQAQFNEKIGRLLHEIKSEKPAFRDSIVKEDLLKCVVVQALKNNSRIIKQDGAFIISGLSRNNEGAINALRYRDASKKQQIYLITDKRSIRRQLETYSINHAALFPEIDDVADFIKTKFG